MTHSLFCDPSLVAIPCPGFVLAEEFRAELDPLAAFAQLALHSSANKLDVPVDKHFKREGDIFIAETGSFLRVTGAEEFTGHRVVGVDRQSGDVLDFLVNEGDTAEEIFNPESVNKPIDVKFRGPVMLVVDFGVFEPGLGLVQPGTGKLWLVSHGLGKIRRSR